MWQWTG